MTFAYETKKVKIRAIGKDVIAVDMSFEERMSAGGIVLKSDNGKTHGIRPRWAKVYKVGPEQTEVEVGDWILVEHGRWTRGMMIDDGTGEFEIRKIDTNCIMARSSVEPGPEDEYFPKVNY
jgi:co-chaperonin GroES (HSP10)